MDAFTDSATQATHAFLLTQVNFLTKHFKMHNFIMPSLRPVMFKYNLPCVGIVMGLICA